MIVILLRPLILGGGVFSIMIVVSRNALERFDKPLLSSFSKIKSQHLILHDIHCNGIGQIFIENLAQNQRFCCETGLFRLTYSIILRRF